MKNDASTWPKLACPVVDACHGWHHTSICGNEVVVSYCLAFCIYPYVWRPFEPLATDSISYKANLWRNGH